MTARGTSKTPSATIAFAERNGPTTGEDRHISDHPDQ